MARAKRTDRAEARRRYRDAASAPADTEADVEAPAVPEAARPRERRDRRPAAAQPAAAQAPARGGFGATIRQAASPADIRGDLRALPSLLVRSKAFLIPSGIVIATTAAMMIPAFASSDLVVLAGNIILQPPPMIIAFLAGMLAPRAAWLLGGIVSVLAGIGYVIYIVSSADSQVTPLGFTYVYTTEQKLSYVQSVLLTAPVFGMAVGAFAGFYRRFLSLSQPQRRASGRR